MYNIELNKPEALKMIITWSFIGSIFCNKFRSFKRAMICILHKNGVIDLSITSPDEFTGVDLCKLLDQRFKKKIKKIEFYELMDLSKTTFNKYFKEYLENNNMKGRRSYTLVESYGLIRCWQGEGELFQFKHFKKQEIVEKLSMQGYKDLAMQFKAFLKDENSYKGVDKLSPRIVKQFLKHIDIDHETYRRFCLRS